MGFPFWPYNSLGGGRLLDIKPEERSIAEEECTQMEVRMILFFEWSSLLDLQSWNKIFLW